MKQPADTVTPELHLDGQPVFDLDHEHPWPMPAGGKWEPAPRELSLKEKWRMAAARKVEAVRP